MYVAGVDEAGRGPLAGPVCVAAVILPTTHEILGLGDSKKLTAKKRTQLYAQITQQALAYHIQFVDEATIDDMNILQATLWGMQQAVEKLPLRPTQVLVDGNQMPALPAYQVTTVVGGDALHACISAASILAKVARDAHMQKLHAAYPHYGFDSHKGYPTKAHLDALQTHGASPVHRLSYKPVQRMLHRANR